MGDTNLDGLQHSELSLGNVSFAIAIAKLLIGFIILYSEAPYSLINSKQSTFQLIWLSAAAQVGFSLSALVLLLYAKLIFLNQPGSARWIQKFGLVCFIGGIISFLISFTSLIWGYSDTSELLHFSSEARKWVTFLFMVLCVSFGFLFVGIHWLFSYFFFKSGNRRSEYDGLNG